MSETETKPQVAEISSNYVSNENINLETRLYIGNVEFKATEEELRDYFKGFEIEQVDIPKKNLRGRKYALGFAFINLASADDIDKFIDKYNGTSFKERVITVKKATPPTKEGEGETKAAKTASKKKTAKKTKATTKSSESEGSESAEDSAKDADATLAAPATAKKATKAKKTAKPKVAPKPKVPLSEGTTSKTTVYITNVDFKLNTKQLSDYLKTETKYDPVWVHVPTQRLPGYLVKVLKKKNVPIRYKSRGFAFIKFNTEEEQKEFIKDFDGKVINDREISVKAAIDLPNQEEFEKSESAETEEKEEEAEESK